MMIYVDDNEIDEWQCEDILYSLVGDVNNDGLVDIIIIGNDDDVNQVLVNGGNDSFDDGMDFPDGRHGTYSKTADDINNDGMVHTH